MIPVIDLGRIFILIAKIAIFSTFTALFFSQIDVVTSSLFNIVSYVRDLLGGITNVDLGCFADNLGVTSFLNSIVNQFVVTATFTVSSIASILSYRMIVRFFGIFMSM